MTAKRTYQRHRAAIALLLLSSAYSLPAGAETLQGALAKAYASNPTLTGARAGQRAMGLFQSGPRKALRRISQWG